MAPKSPLARSIAGARAQSHNGMNTDAASDFS